jgi:hypothetical protein
MDRAPRLVQAAPDLTINGWDWSDWERSTPAKHKPVPVIQSEALTASRLNATAADRQRQGAVGPAWQQRS